MDTCFLFAALTIWDVHLRANFHPNFRYAISKLCYSKQYLARIDLFASFSTEEQQEFSFLLRQYMRLRWLPGNSVALIILPASAPSASAQQLCLMMSPFCFSHNHSRVQNRRARTTNTADIQQNGEGVDYSGAQVRAKLRENFHRG